jgi:hypothetical protein
MMPKGFLMSFKLELAGGSNQALSVCRGKGWLTMRFRWALMPTGIGGIGRT